MWLLALCLALSCSVDAQAGKKRRPKVHHVARGQSLGKIARRYGVNIDAICHANNIEERAPIRPGQRLYIPPKDDPEGKRTRLARDERKKRTAKRRDERSRKRPKNRKLKWHKVYRGQRLGSIAKRYNVTLDAIRHANAIGRGKPIHPGERLIIPHRDDRDGAEARAARRKYLKLPVEETKPTDDTDVSDEPPSWAKYLRKPKKRGYVHIVGRKNRRFDGYVIGKGDRVLPKARKAVETVLAASNGEQIQIDPRLVRLLARVSDSFGARTIRIVSGYRLGTTPSTSRHRVGRAIDFTVDGVPNEALRDYVKTFEKVGIGYYPNSHFIHLDVRDRWTYWIDYSGPGEPPRYGGFWAKSGQRVR